MSSNRLSSPFYRINAGLRTTKVKKLTQAIISGEFPDTLIQCLVDHDLNCPKYMSLSFQSLTSWAKFLEKKVCDPKLAYT